MSTQHVAPATSPAIQERAWVLVALAWLSRISADSTYAGRVLPALLMLGVGVGCRAYAARRAAHHAANASSAAAAAARMTSVTICSGQYLDAGW